MVLLLSNRMTECDLAAWLASGRDRKRRSDAEQLISRGFKIVDPDILIRPETPADLSGIWHATKRAFAGRSYSDGTEQDIVDALRERGALAISLVAEQRGAILGHVAFSPASAEDGSPGWYTLGPVSVEPEVQRCGIGKALIATGIARLRELDAAGCIVLGDTTYYSQCGFAKAPNMAPAGVPKEHFMVLCLGSEIPKGVVDFHEVFHQEG
jgi:putative acetyltransferase